MVTTTSSAITIYRILPKGTITDYTAANIQWLVKLPNGTTRFLADNLAPGSVTDNPSTDGITDGRISHSFSLDGGDGLYRFTLFFGDESDFQTTLGTTTVKKISNVIEATI